MNSSKCENKPLVSLCVLFYNQENFVDEAIDGVLSQTYENCEVILSDDCSTDSTYEHILNKVSNYSGNKKIIVNRNEKNVGLVPHVNRLIYTLSHGTYIILTGGDDISLPNRVMNTVELFLSNPNASMVTLSCVIIDKSGKEKSTRISKDRLICCTDQDYLRHSSMWIGNLAMAYRRDILLSYSPLSDDCQTEDSTLRFRSMLKGPILDSSIVGIKYRVHGNNISIGNLKYKLKSHEIAEQYRKDLLANINCISSKTYRILQKKIDYYERFREISSKQALSNNNILTKFSNRIKHYLLRKLYHVNVSIYLYNK